MLNISTILLQISVYYFEVKKKNMPVLIES